MWIHSTWSRNARGATLDCAVCWRPMRRGLVILLLVVASLVCGIGEPPTKDNGSKARPTRQVWAETLENTWATLLSQASAVAERAEPRRAVSTDPYAQWDTWCEPLDYDTPCKTNDDCSDIQHVSRRSLRCVHPYWAKEAPDYKICAPGFSTRQERVWRKTRLREIVAQAYFDEAEQCSDWEWRAVRSRKGNVLSYERVFLNGRALHRQFWKCTQQQTKAEKLTRYLNTIYARETSRRPWKRHRLDVEPNREAWLHEASVYGWKVELSCRNGKKRCTRAQTFVTNVYPDQSATRRNPHFPERWRWRYGLGAYGKNAAYGTQDWDPLAPPEILCLEVPGTEAYMRDVRDAVSTYTSARPPVCGGKPFRGHAVDPSTGEIIAAPSWVDVHRVASQGRWCPQPSRDQNFRERAINNDLDPDELVTMEMLGKPLPKEEQNQIARKILRRLEKVLPPPWTEVAVEQGG